MYHFQDVTLSFTRRNSIIYEAQVANLRMPRHKTPSLNREGWGGSLVVGCLLTLHRNVLSSNKLHRKVKLFYLLQYLYNTTSIHPVDKKSIKVWPYHRKCLSLQRKVQYKRIKDAIQLRYGNNDQTQSSIFPPPKLSVGGAEDRGQEAASQCEQLSGSSSAEIAVC